MLLNILSGICWPKSQKSGSEQNLLSCTIHIVPVRCSAYLAMMLRQCYLMIIINVETMLSDDNYQCWDNAIWW